MCLAKKISFSQCNNQSRNFSPTDQQFSVFIFADTYTGLLYYLIIRFLCRAQSIIAKFAHTAQIQVANWTGFRTSLFLDISQFIIFLFLVDVRAANRKPESPQYLEMWTLYFVATRGVTRGLSQVVNFAEGGPVSTRRGPPTNQHSEKQLRNDSESWCGCLY